MAAHSSILAWRIPWTEEPGALQPMKSQKGHWVATNTWHFFFFSRETSEPLKILQHGIVKCQCLVLAFDTCYSTEVIDAEKCYLVLCSRPCATGRAPRPGSSQPVGAPLPKPRPFPGCSGGWWVRHVPVQPALLASLSEGHCGCIPTQFLPQFPCPPFPQRGDPEDSPANFCMPSPGRLLSGALTLHFCPFVLFMEFWGQEYWSDLPSLLQWTTLDSTTDSVDMSWSKPREILKDREAWHAAVHGVAKSWTRLSDRATTPCIKPLLPFEDFRANRH